MVDIARRPCVARTVIEHTMWGMSSTSLDPGPCPLSGRDNRCAMEIERQTGVARLVSGGTA